jgi:hypothetical protein
MRSKLAYLILCRCIQLLALLARGDPAKDLELIVLRHQLSVLCRQVPHPGWSHRPCPLAASSRVQAAETESLRLQGGHSWQQAVCAQAQGDDGDDDDQAHRHGVDLPRMQGGEVHRGDRGRAHSGGDLLNGAQ